MRIEILDEAEKDIENGYYFYEKQYKGLGSYFTSSIFADIDSLQFYAGIHIKIKNFHRLLTKRFPFSIYYKLETDIVKVFAILDNRKSPSYRIERLN